MNTAGYATALYWPWPDQIYEAYRVPEAAEAAKWYRLAADRLHPQAQYNLGLLYATGEGVAQDNVMAHMWLNLAAAQFRYPTPASSRTSG